MGAFNVELLSYLHFIDCLLCNNMNITENNMDYIVFFQITWVAWPNYTHMHPLGEEKLFSMVDTADVVALLSCRKDRHD